jgi:uncharacterized repeat protein (TIGR01451 family)
MTNFFASAGTSPKITARFKSKVFSFADVLVDDSKLTLYQISEPLTNSSSATQTNPYPFGKDINGNRLNDPIPNTVFDPATLNVISAPAVGTPALLDKITVEKPDLKHGLSADLSGPKDVVRGAQFVYTIEVSNHSGVALNGTQVVLTLSDGVTYSGASGGSAIVDGSKVVVTIGRLKDGSAQTVQVTVQAPASAEKNKQLKAQANVRSSTALPVDAGSVNTKVD